MFNTKCHISKLIKLNINNTYLIKLKLRNILIRQEDLIKSDILSLKRII